MLIDEYVDAINDRAATRATGENTSKYNQELKLIELDTVYRQGNK